MPNAPRYASRFVVVLIIVLPSFVSGEVVEEATTIAAGSPAEAAITTEAATAEAPPVEAAAEEAPEAATQTEEAPIEGTSAEETPAETPASSVPFVQVRAVAEFGFLGVPAHTIQFGKTGSVINLVTEGGQDNLAPFGRVSTELTLGGAHTIIFLYQPLELRTNAVFERDITIDSLVFPEGTPVDVRYGFDFWRLGYHYNFFADEPGMELSLGLGLQIRNAAIEFTSSDGTLRRTNHDIGPVPLIKLRGRYTWQDVGVWLGGEVDGFYAPIKYLNGKGSDVVGAIIDLSARAGYNVWGPMDVFLNVRYLAGGAEGTGTPDGPGSDGWVANWLHFISVTLGVELRLHELI
jgi:hypothetical protein